MFNNLESILEDKVMPKLINFLESIDLTFIDIAELSVDKSYELIKTKAKENGIIIKSNLITESIVLSKWKRKAYTFENDKKFEDIIEISEFNCLPFNCFLTIHKGYLPQFILFHSNKMKNSISVFTMEVDKDGKTKAASAILDHNKTIKQSLNNHGIYPNYFQFKLIERAVEIGRKLSMDNSDIVNYAPTVTYYREVEEVPPFKEYEREEYFTSSTYNLPAPPIRKKYKIVDKNGNEVGPRREGTPGPRRAHWHRYWCGSGDKKHLERRWLKETFCRPDLVNKAPVSVSDPESETEE